MIVTIEGNICKVSREKGDRVYRDNGWGGADSHFLHHVKLALIEQGHDLIKKLAHKDGHMVSDHVHYLRVRRLPRRLTKADIGKIYCVWHADYQVCSIAEAFNGCAPGDPLDHVHLRVIRITQNDVDSNNKQRDQEAKAKAIERAVQREVKKFAVKNEANACASANVEHATPAY